jgi:hypothetical protein
VTDRDMHLTPLGTSGRVFVGRVAQITTDGAELLVSIRIEPNTEDGRVLMDKAKALEVAARLMVHADAT